MLVTSNVKEKEKKRNIRTGPFVMICLSRICSSMISIANYINMGMIYSKKKNGCVPKKNISVFLLWPSSFSLPVVFNQMVFLPPLLQALETAERMLKNLHCMETSRDAFKGHHLSRQWFLKGSPHEDAEEEKLSESIGVWWTLF